MNKIPTITITVEKGESAKSKYQFSGSFTIGRDENCDIHIQNTNVSRRHAEGFFKDGTWWIGDLYSRNGTYVNGRRIDKIPAKNGMKLELGKGEVVLSIQIPQSQPHTATVADRDPSVTQYIKHYFDDTPNRNMGDHTRMIRDAFTIVQKKSKKKYYLIISMILLLTLFSGLYAYMQHQNTQRQREIAENIFYSMKSMELELTRLQGIARITEDERVIQEVQQYRSRKQELLRSYDDFIDELNIYSARMDDVDRLIYRIARIFGESELNLPPDFAREVRNYIRKWQSSNRLEHAISRAVANGYHELISQTMLDHDLPPQFFYLALQESDFRHDAVGPTTRFGIAKGIWQFIPDTALRYGLRTGPLVEVRRYDPRDDRFHFESATAAAARYIRDIYETEAQASGLLVMGSYNWGERNVRSLIRRMPENPRERNFWQLLRHHRQRIPQETYDYVFYIISAAVIGENPQLFGFNFDNPLQFTQAVVSDVHMHQNGIMND
jgi:membrane-bound lytic murein transglycosylase D